MWKLERVSSAWVDAAAVVVQSSCRLPFRPLRGRDVRRVVGSDFRSGEGVKTRRKTEALAGSDGDDRKRAGPGQS